MSLLFVYYISDEVKEAYFYSAYYELHTSRRSVVARVNEKSRVLHAIRMLIHFI